MKIYNVIEFFISNSCNPEVNVYPFVTIEKAVNAFNEISDAILEEVKEEFDDYGTDDDDAEAVYQRDDVCLVCDAWKSYSALDWEHSVRVEEKEAE